MESMAEYDLLFGSQGIRKYCDCQNKYYYIILFNHQIVEKYIYYKRRFLE